MTGHYITIEGPEGCGKSTQVILLKKYLEGQGLNVVNTKQPGGTPVGADIREIILHPKNPLLPKAESMLFWVDRYLHYETFVKPMLKSNYIVIGDRDLDSSWAYQHYARGIEKEWMEQIQELTIGDFRPGLTIAYVGNVNIFLDRIKSRYQTGGEITHFDNETKWFHNEVINGFKSLAKENPRIKLVQADRDISSVFKETKEIVNQFLEDRL